MPARNLLYFILLWDYWCAFYLCFSSTYVHRYKVEDYYLVVYCEAGSTPEELLQGQGRILFYGKRDAEK
jgi:hypothetical protein